VDQGNSIITLAQVTSVRWWCNNIGIYHV